MKKVLKRSLSLLLAITIIFSSAYVGLSEVDFDGVFAVKAKAASGSEIVAYARQFIGYPYVWGTQGPNSFDCSGFTQYVFKHFGISLPATTGTIYDNSENYGVVVGTGSTTNAVAGDLISWYGHIAIYTENGYCVEALNPTYGVCEKFKVDAHTNGLNYKVIRVYGVGENPKPSDAWVSLPNGNESSYLVNTDVPITIGANNARYYTIVIYRDGEHYYEETFYSESGSYTIPASFDKTGHYSCYVIARYTYDGEFVTSSWQGWDIVDDVPQNLTVSVNKPLDRDFYPGEIVKVTANATYGYQKYVCIHRADGSFYAGNYVNGTEYSCVISEPGEYYVNFEAFNACGSNLSKDLYFTVADVDAYIILPDSVGYSYLVNEEVPMKMVAPGATHFRIVMEKDGEFYYENLFYNESGSHTIPASFDKIGHYTGYMIATNSSGLEVVSEVYSWDVVNDVPQNLSISTNKNIYLPGETIEFTMNAEGGQKKYIGIHKADGSFFNGGYLIGNVYHIRITAPGDYYADFEAMNVCGNKISGKVYFSVKEIHPTTEETLIDYSNNLIYTSVENCGDIAQILELSDTADVTIFASQNNNIYGTGTVIFVYEGDTQVGVFDLIVNGDTNGDSVCDALDAAQVALDVNGQKTMDGLSKTAADNNQDDEISIEDYQAIVNRVVA